MPVRAQGTRKSSFPVSTIVDSGASFDYFASGVNYSITFDNLKTAFGVTGTLAASGDLLATPVLTSVGSDYKIRSLENGSGIKATISPEDGITIAHNFSNASGADIPMIGNISASSPVIKGLSAGPGISIGEEGNVVTVTATGDPVSTKTVIVSQLSDLPSPSSGVITLADNTEYLQVNDVNIGANRILMGDNSAYTSSSSEVISLISELGAGYLFTASSSTVAITNIQIICPLMDFISFSSVSGTDTLIVDQVTLLGANSIGLVSNPFAIRWERFFCDQVFEGLTFSGNISAVLFNAWVINSVETGPTFDFGSATFSGGTIQNCFLVHQASAYFLSGLVDSGNVNTGAIFTIFNNRVIGGLGLENIETDDAQYQFALNDTLADTRADAMVSLTGNATETVISSVGVPAQAAGTYVVEREGQFTCSTGGICTYEGVKPAVLPIDASFSLLAASGGDKQATGYLAINGVVIASSSITVTMNSAKAGSGSCHWQVQLNPTDDVSFWVSNDSDTTNIVVSQCVLRVN